MGWFKSENTNKRSTLVARLMLAGFIFTAGVSVASAQAITENFDVVPVAGWTTQNNSVPVGSTGWFAGNSAVFPSQAGAPNAYIGSNFNATTGANTISNWLIVPNRTMVNGDTYRFWTRTTTANPFPDRLQVRLSTAGASTNVGTGPTGLGDFTTLLLDINPTYDIGGVYPEVWTQFTVTISGLAGPTSGRIAFRYFVENGGPAGDNSNFIGIDTFSYTPFVAAGDAPVDFNGDGKTDWAVSRNSGGAAAGQIRWYWNINGSAAPTAASDWGSNADTLTPADFDGDQKDDIAVWRSGAATVASFYILNSATSTLRQEAFGQTNDNPTVVNDYNGDGKDDIAVYRSGSPGVWYYRTVANGPVNNVVFGTTGDFVAPGDYNGDGTADFGIQRAGGGGGQFWVRLSNGTVNAPVTFGLSTDFVTTGDFDGDSKTDFAVARGAGGAYTWYWRPSSGGADQQTTFGATATDQLIPGDYDGDAKTDAAVFRNGVFYARSTGSGAVSFFTLGSTGDRTPAGYNVH